MNAAPQQRAQIDALAAGVLIGFNLLLGFNQALVKVVNAGFAPIFQAGLRSACAFVPVLAFAWLARKRLSLSDGSLPYGVLNGLLFSGEFCLLFLALDYTSVSRASLFFYTMPVWVALVAHFVLPGERLTVPRVAGMALALAGVALVLGGRAGAEPTPHPHAWIGDLLAIVASMFWAGIALLTRLSRLNRCSPEMNLLYQLAVSAILLLPLAWLLGDTVREPTATILLAFAFQSLVIVGIGFTVWFWILSIYPVSNMTSFALLAPLAGVLSGWLLFDDAIGARFALAFALVAGGLVLINRPARAAADTAPAR